MELITKRFDTQLAVKLTQGELVHRGRALASAHGELGAELEAQGQAKQEMKAKLSLIENKIGELSRAITEGEEMRTVQVEEVLDLEKDSFVRRRCDTGEVLYARKLNAEERQAPMPFDARPADEPKPDPKQLPPHKEEKPKRSHKKKAK